MNAIYGFIALKLISKSSFNRIESKLIVSGGFELYQNHPNLFERFTSIGFHLPAATMATLTVYDESGRTIFTQKGDFAKGYNVISLNSKDLGDAGVMYYELHTSTDATRKMVQLR